MRVSKLPLIALFALLGLALAACGAPTSPTWPGLVTDGEVAYVALGGHVRAVKVSADDPLAFSEAWSFPAGKADNQIGTLIAEPGIGGDLIVVGSQGPSNSYSGILYGLDPATGARRWCLAFDYKAAGRDASCPPTDGAPRTLIAGIGPAVDSRVVGGIALTGTVAYVGLGSGTVYAIDAATGKDLWHFKAARDVWAAPLVNGEAIYVASLDHHLYAINRANGSLLWEKDMGAAVAGTPTLVDGVLYVGTFGNRLVALDARSGDTRWRFTTTNWVWNGPAVADGLLYFTDVSGMVYAIDANGSQVWAVHPAGGGQMRARPLLVGDLLYLGDRTGNLFALNRADGSVRYQAQRREGVRPGQLLAAPVLAGDSIIVAPYTGDEVLVAYSPDLQFQWSIPVSK